MNVSLSVQLNGDAFPVCRRALAMQVTYRWMEEGDFPFLTALYRSTREAELDRTHWSEAEKRAFIEMQFRAQHQHYQAHYPGALWLIIERSGIPVGRLYLERWRKEHRIIDIALTPEARGKGTGSAIVKDLMEEASQTGKSVSIHVEKHNPAMNLYKRLGFYRREDKGVYDLMVWYPRS